MYEVRSKTKGSRIRREKTFQSIPPSVYKNTLSNGSDEVLVLGFETADF
jgi:hypothetical protein